MKRHLTTCALCALLASPLMAQDSYYRAYGYSPDPGYNTDSNTRQFNFNPGNMMNRVENPMRNMFGSAKRSYNEYPAEGYAPYNYPPVYGYPAYHQPYPNYGYTPQEPVNRGYLTPYGSPQAYPGPAPRPAMQAPAHGATPHTVRDRQPMLANPDQGGAYRFRPLDETAAPEGGKPAPQPLHETTASPGDVAMTPSAPAYREPKPLAPLTYSDAQPQPSTPEKQVRNTLTEQDPRLKFRPLDKPGYSSDLGE